MSPSKEGFGARSARVLNVHLTLQVPASAESKPTASGPLHGEVASIEHVHSDERIESQAVSQLEPADFFEHKRQSRALELEPDPEEEAFNLCLAMGRTQWPLPQLGKS